MPPTLPAVHEIDLTPAAPALRAQRIGDLIDLYLAELSRRRQQKTVTGYRAKLSYFLDWWEATGPACDWLLSADGLADFARHLESLKTARGRPLGYHTRNDALRRLRQVLHWAHERGRVAVDMAADVPEPSGSPPSKLPVELDALAALLAAAGQGDNPARDAAIVAVLAGTGVRCEEAAAMLVENVTLYADRSGFVRLTVTKFDQERIVAFDGATGEYVRRWLDASSRQAGPLFPSRTGRRTRSLSPSGIYKVVVSLADAAGVRSVIRGPHDLRRMFATLWARRLRGESYGQLLQKQLGHASWATTSQYALQDYGDVLEVMRTAAVSPLAQLAQVRSEGLSPMGLRRSEG